LFQKKVCFNARRNVLRFAAVFPNKPDEPGGLPCLSGGISLQTGKLYLTKSHLFK
jgi:hypothetical protein